MKRLVVRSLIAALVVSAPGCSRAESDARRDHILAADHGWIDLTLKAPVGAAAGADLKRCDISFGFHGESLLDASADLAQAEANKILVGYRFPAPAGMLHTELTIAHCVKNEVVVKLPLDLKKDHLAELEFDGTTVLVKSSAPYEPTSLEWVRTQILEMQAENGASSTAVSTLTKIALASLGLNFLMLLLMMWTWRGKKAQGE